MGPGKGLSGSTLKLIAVITMFIDHIGAGLLEVGMPQLLGTDTFYELKYLPVWNRIYYLDQVFRIIGRLAFPIFCFLLAEGFCHTRDVKKYAGRLLLFSVISEIPFDLAFSDRAVDFSAQNVYVTLFIGLVVLIFYERWQWNPIRRTFVMLAGCCAAYAVRCDYDVIGIVMILSFYVLRSDKRLRTVMGALLAALESIRFWGTAALALLPIHWYDGTRGRKDRKCFFYWFYPAHLLLIYGVRRLLL